jgi:hypothetical protein
MIYKSLSASEAVAQVVADLSIPFKPAPLQIEDAISAVIAGRFALLYEVGVGKTVTATLAATALDSEYKIVICPPIILDQWREWLNDIGIKDVSIYRGARRTVDMLDHHWVLMSHAIFRDSFEVIKARLAQRDATLIVDEAQALKNPQSKLFKCVNQFVAPDRHLLLLTATPTSKPEDTYTYIKLKTPTLYRSWGHWQNLHVLDRDIFGTITKYQNLEMLADRFAMQSVKRTKRDVFGDVMEPIYQRMPYELDPKHYKLYVRLAEEQLLLLANGDKIDATTAQRLRHALQQIVVNYGKFSGNPEDRSRAYDIIDQVIEEVDPMDKSKSKLVIWTYYVSTSESVTAYLKQKFGDRAVVAAYGKVNSQKAIDAIMKDSEARILVAQPSSCGVGLNLQHVCWENLFIELSTTPMQVRQATGRTDRINQKNRPTMRFAQALKTIQIKLFNDLLANDDLVTQVERNLTSLRQEIFGERNG